MRGNVLDFSFQPLKQLAITVTLHQRLPERCPEATPAGQPPSHIVTSAALPGSERVYSNTSSTSQACSQKLSVHLLGGEDTGRTCCSQPYRCQSQPTLARHTSRAGGFTRSRDLLGALTQMCQLHLLCVE